MRLHVLITVNTRLWSSFQSFEVVQSTPLFFWDVALHHGVIASNVQVYAVASSSRATCQMLSEHLTPEDEAPTQCWNTGQQNTQYQVRVGNIPEVQISQNLVPREGMLHSLVRQSSVLKMDAAGSSETSIHILKLHSFTTQLFNL